MIIETRDKNQLDKPEGFTQTCTVSLLNLFFLFA